MASNSEKIIIYQIFTRLYGNRNTTRKENGTIEENGCGKLNDFTPTTLKKIREMGVSHIWYTGVIRHATQTDQGLCRQYIRQRTAGEVVYRQQGHCSLRP